MLMFKKRIFLRKEDLNSISQEFYETCALHNQIMYFVPWFITTYLPLYINVIERTYKDGITFSAFQKFIEDDIASISITEINKLVTQNNYLSLYVKADIAKTNLASTSESKPEFVLIHVQRPPEIQDFKFGSLNDFEELLDKKFSQLDFKGLINKKFSGLKFKPIDLSLNFADKMENTAQDRGASIHTITSDSNSVVEKVKIDPRTNIVQVNDDVSDKDIPSIFEMDKEDLNSISQEFYETCALNNQIMYFVPWFITTYLPLYINVIERTYKDGSGNLTKAIYPQDIASISIAKINKLITQNNYLSLYVKVLGENISSLDKKLDDLTILIKDIKADIAKTNLASTSESEPEVVLTHVQRPPEIQDFKFGTVNDF
ncbi:hypothetical protein H5410_041031 [Solanum commersonii]|uniref:DUF7588 domain-containing protein n=1 Tax=Solanum commersonii TaxID=4109 RepID=A0A9J5XRV7_SOLCO|nr:hypothetical protein H5410_041031 [Solanum commersonii]